MDRIRLLVNGTFYALVPEQQLDGKKLDFSIAVGGKTKEHSVVDEGLSRLSSGNLNKSHPMRCVVLLLYC